jgi:hypothetical protein
MNRHIGKTLIALALLSLGLSAAAAPQYESEHSCCLAVEWILPADPRSAQSSEHFCCLASEWRAVERPTAPQSDTAAACCLAREWQGS